MSKRNTSAKGVTRSRQMLLRGGSQRGKRSPTRSRQMLLRGEYLPQSRGAGAESAELNERTFAEPHRAGGLLKRGHGVTRSRAALVGDDDPVKECAARILVELEQAGFKTKPFAIHGSAV